MTTDGTNDKERRLMTIHVGDLRVRTQRVIETFEESRDGLFRADAKTPIYGDDEHAERLGALRSERNAVLREVEEQVKAAIEEANADLTALENGDQPHDPAHRRGARAGESEESARL